MSKITQIVREIFGRTKDDEMLDQVKGFIADIYGTPDIDTTKSDYSLTKSIYYSSDYGYKDWQKFSIGSVFGKPIVNTAVNFAQPEPYQIECEDDYAMKLANDFLKNSFHTLVDWQKYGFRDGDSYIRMDDKGEVEIVPAELVTIHYNDQNINEITGYDIKTVVPANDGTGTNITYIEYLRKDSPYREVYKYTSSNFDKSQGELLPEYTETGLGERSLPMIAYQHNKEPRSIRGISEYQNTYGLMAEYTKIYKNGVANFMYNSKSIPVFQGIRDVAKFIKTNFSKDSYGNWKMNWDERKMIVGGEGLQASMLSGPQMAGECEKFLNITFWLICQASETPEFVFGTAVQSSKASVSEQMPVVVQKAKRNQSEFINPLTQLIDLFFEVSSKFDTSLNIPKEYTVNRPKIISDDLKLNLEIIKTLKADGLITDKTALILAGMDNYIDDLDAEIEQARKEEEEKNERSDLFANNPQDQLNSLNNQKTDNEDIDN